MSDIRKARALVISGDGINCENETAQAFRVAGFETDIRHINDLMSEHLSTDQLSSTYQAVGLPGGFSFGDDLSSGKIFALKLLYGLKWDFGMFAERGGVVIGICNGFQAMIRMGVFGKTVSITQNESGKFINTWVKLTPSPSKCVWLKGIGTLELPIRHGEGRILFSSSSQKETLIKMEQKGMLCLRYEGNPNGSSERLAGICDPTGRIFGLMPHPEAFLRWTAHPEWTTHPSRAGSPGQGLTLFENALKEVMGSK